MTADELVELYRLDQERRGLSKRYISGSTEVVRRFEAWLAPRDLLTAERSDIEAWIDSLAVGTGARRNYVSFLHAFYEYAADRSGNGHVPTARIRRPRQHRHPPRPIPDADLRKALAHATSPRLRCWLVLAAFEGLRCQEIAGVEVDDVDRGAGVLHVSRGKGGKRRFVPLHPEAVLAFERLQMPGRGPVFRHDDGSRVAPWVVSQNINRHLRALGITSTAHSLRHWFGTRLYQSTSDLRLVQEMLAARPGVGDQVARPGKRSWRASVVAVPCAGGRVATALGAASTLRT